MTCPPNAFVTTEVEDVLVLEPGQQVTQTWGVQVLSSGSKRSRRATLNMNMKSSLAGGCAVRGRPHGIGAWPSI
jgi:hypothetical protein